MKTMSFGKITVSHTEDGDCILSVYNPSEGTVKLSLSADELMMFLVECGNGLKDARGQQVVLTIERNLKREEERR